MSINFRELLKKYMYLVACEEGTTFLFPPDTDGRNWYPYRFTDEEWAALTEIERELPKEAI